jgi:K+-sensing histidine kinase KdpD
MRWSEIRKRIEEAMTAVAFAEEGEFETARQMLKNKKTANKRVLLGTDAEEIDRQFIKYALQLCNRLGAGLEIVHLVEEKDPNSGPPNRELQQLKKSLEEKNIVYQAVAGGSLEEEVERYSKGRRDILCVVLESSTVQPQEKHGAAGKRENKFLKNLSCPVVLFESQARA